MTGGNYEIIADSFSFTGTSESASAGSLLLTDTGGEFFATTTNAGSFELFSGFQAASKDSLSLTLDSAEVNLGELSVSSVATSDIVATVTAEHSGYTLFISEDGDLRAGQYTIDDVTDGQVSAGSEEYGIKTIGGHGVITNDTAIANNITIAHSDTEATAINTTIRFSAAISTQSFQGNYGHTLSFSLVANP